MNATAETQLMNLLPEAQVFQVVTPGGASLTGWFMPRRQGRGMAPALVYFGDNAEDATEFMSSQYKTYPDVSLVAVDYRGYGHSTGRPDEKDLMDDALTVYDQAVTETGGQGFVVGRGLGSGLAVHVAANRQVLGAILITPYDSLLKVAKAHYPFLPVPWLLKEHYDVTDEAGRAEAPMLMLTASQDDVVPRERSQALYDAWKGPKHEVSILMAGHTDIDSYGNYATAIQDFLKEPSR